MIYSTFLRILSQYYYYYYYYYLNLVIFYFFWVGGYFPCPKNILTLIFQENNSFKFSKHIVQCPCSLFILLNYFQGKFMNLRVDQINHVSMFVVSAKASCLHGMLANQIKPLQGKDKKIKVFQFFGRRPNILTTSPNCVCSNFWSA